MRTEKKVKELAERAKDSKSDISCMLIDHLGMTQLDHDSVIEYISKALEHISTTELEDLENVREELICNVSEDTDTDRKKLSSWLDRDIKNFSWITEDLVKNIDPEERTGPEILYEAQEEARQTIYMGVLDSLLRYLQDEDEEYRDIPIYLYDDEFKEKGGD